MAIYKLITKSKMCVLLTHKIKIFNLFIENKLNTKKLEKFMLGKFVGLDKNSA